MKFKLCAARNGQALVRVILKNKSFCVNVRKLRDTPFNVFGRTMCVLDVNEFDSYVILIDCDANVVFASDMNIKFDDFILKLRQYTQKKVA